MTIQRNNLAIDFIMEGEDEITLLFVHGSFINKDYWKDQVTNFSKKYLVVAPDLAGHGKSGRGRSNWTIEEFGRDIIELISQLNLSNIILIGHSLGGDIILETAVAYPSVIKGLIGVDCFKMAGTALPSDLQSQVETILSNLRKNFPDFSEAYARQVLLTKQTDEAISNRVIKDWRSADQQMGVSSLASAFNYWKRERELLQKLPFKLHLINCDYMPTHEEPLRQYARSGYELVPIHASSHFPMIEKPDEFNFLLQQSINTILTEKDPTL